MKKLLTLIFGILLISCGSNTSIVHSWKEPNSNLTKEKFKKVLVVALIKDEATRRMIENKIAARNPIFHSSFAFLNEKNLDLSKEERINILNSENFDGAITMRLVSVQKETYYVPGTNTGAYYNNGFSNWYGAYSYNYYTPGYYNEETSYIVETNIFSLTQNKLIWTGTTKSLNIDDISRTTDEIIEEVIHQMKKDGFMEKK
jgi:hypothetical protein